MSWMDLPEWGRYLVQGLGLCLHLVFASIIVSRTGRSAYWSLITIVPYFYVLTLALWGFAFCKWPKREA